MSGKQLAELRNQNQPKQNTHAMLRGTWSSLLAVEFLQLGQFQSEYKWASGALQLQLILLLLSQLVEVEQTQEEAVSGGGTPKVVKFEERVVALTEREELRGNRHEAVSGDHGQQTNAGNRFDVSPSRTGCIFTGQGGEREKAVGGFLFLNLFQVFLSSKSGYPRP